MTTGSITFLHSGSGLDVSISFDVPECKYVQGGGLVRDGRWMFHQSWHVTGMTELPEISLYREAIYLLMNQLQKWLVWLDRAVKYERGGSVEPDPEEE